MKKENVNFKTQKKGKKMLSIFNLYLYYLSHSVQVHKALGLLPGS